MTTMKFHSHDVVIHGRFLREGRLEQEWFEDLENPHELVEALRVGPVRADILTFWQRLPDVVPKYSYYKEWDEIAALPLSTYDHWWNNQIKSRTRGLIRKSEKQGVSVCEVEYTDAFVAGMTRIFNETPLRQGRPFIHYGKDFETVKRQFSRYLFREKLIGAYYDGQLIGFMMIGFADRYAVTGQIISMVSHRDKGTNNLLIAKAVEMCTREKVGFLVYLHWGVGSLAEFKRRNGFEKVRLPRYYVPLTARGKLALRMSAHRGVLRMLPEATIPRLKQLRVLWYKNLYALRYRQVADIGEY
jgi:hypothetical protein